MMSPCNLIFFFLESNFTKIYLIHMGKASIIRNHFLNILIENHIKNLLSVCVWFNSVFPMNFFYEFETQKVVLFLFWRRKYLFLFSESIVFSDYNVTLFKYHSRFWWIPLCMLVKLRILVSCVLLISVHPYLATPLIFRSFVISDQYA